MSGIFTAIIPATAVTAAVDLMEVVGHSTRPYIWLELHLYQLTELGDAAEEQLNLALKSGQTTSGSGGNAAASANATEGGSGATSGFTFETLNTTKASAGTIITHYTWGWNVRGPLDVIFTELAQSVQAAARRSTLELVAAPADSVTIGGWALLQEIGS